VKRLRLFIMAIVTLLVVPASMVALAPTSVEAGINSFVWLDTAYKGDDPLLGTNVQAYEAGSTATLLVSIQNTTGDTITIKGAKVKFDWTGGEYAATAGNYPTTLASNESCTATISFTVPETSVASNQVKHSYTVSVDYEKEGGYKAGTQVTRENVGTGNGLNTSYYLQHGPADPATVQVYLDGAATTGYALDCDFQWNEWSHNPKITFNAVVGAGVSISADYQYVESVGTGDGTETVFHLAHYPVVSGSQKVYVDCTLSTAYTLDYDTGEIKFTTAPGADQSIIANYQYMLRWSFEGTNFAVYSTDQNAAMAVKQQLAAIGSPGVATAGSREQMAKAAMEEQLGDQQYAAGNLDQAKTHYDQAFTYMDKALKGDKDPNTFKAIEPAGTLLLGIGMVLLAFSVLVYAMRKPKGP
jgi:hypothetical protein